VIFTVECQGATATPVVGADVVAACSSAGGALVFVEPRSLDPFETPEDMADFLQVAILFFAVVWVGRQLRKSA
jgi:hypothetical protein